MTSQTLTLADFLLARIAEDEAAARSNTDHSEYPRWDSWSVERREDRALLMRQAPPAGRKTVRLDVNHYDITLLDQLARWNPDRVLAECDAKRRIVALHHDSTDEWSDGTTTTGCATCIWAGNDGREYVHDGPCETLQLLALPYADHADYRDEWRP